jgi:hypothetical protein
MNRRKFFNRMTQGLAAAVLATHLHFGNLAPIPQQQKMKWVQLTEFRDAPFGQTNRIEIKYVTDHKVLEALEKFGHSIELHEHGTVEYFQIPAEGNFINNQPFEPISIFKSFIWE